MLGANSREPRILRKESVARVNRVGVGDFCRCNQMRNLEVAVARWGWADANGLVGEPNVQGVAVGLGIHGYRFNTHLSAGANDAHRYFTPVGDEDFINHAANFRAGALGRINQKEGLAVLDWLHVVG